MTAPFQYSEEDWAPIEACLAVSPRIPTSSADAHVREYYNQPGIARPIIEAIVHRYLWMTARTDPRSPEVAAAKACWAKIAKHTQALNAALDELDALETQPARSLGYAIATNPLTPHADYLAGKRRVAAAAQWAATMARGWPKSVRWATDASGRPMATVAGHRRARGDDVDLLIGDLLAFWTRRGGNVGRGISSPSTRFVMAAAGRILAGTVPDVKLPRAIIDIVRNGRGCI